MNQNLIIPLLQLAGALQYLTAGANFLLPTKLQYRANLALVAPIIRQIFYVHSFYIVLILLGFGTLCMAFPHELINTSTGRFLTIFFALFWSLRVILQNTYYDREIKAKNPYGHLFFSLVFLYLAVIFIYSSLCTR